MEISFAPIVKKLLLLPVGAAVWVMITHTESVYLQCAAFAVAAIVPILMMKLDILHPWCWYSGFFLLYTVAYPILYQQGEARFGYDRMILIYHLIALYTLLMVVPAKRVDYGEALETDGFVVSTGVLSRLIYVLVSLLIFGGVVYISRQGFNSKGDIYRSTGPLMAVVFRIPLILSMLVPMVVVDEYNRLGRLSLTSVGLGLAACGALGILSGERDLMLRFLIVIFLLFFALGILKRKHFLPVGGALLAILPLSATYKYFFLAGRVSAVKQSKGFLYSFLTSDFSAGAQNLQVLYEHPEMEGIFGYRRVLQDLVSLFSRSEISLTKWYNNTFFAGEKSGKGFTLAGEGWLIDGVVGIVFVFALLGLLIRVFYRLSRRNMFCFSAYLYFITLVVYAIRGDLATIFSGIVNQILPVEMGIYLLVIMSRRKAELPGAPRSLAEGG